MSRPPEKVPRTNLYDRDVSWVRADCIGWPACVCLSVADIHVPPAQSFEVRSDAEKFMGVRFRVIHISNGLYFQVSTVMYDRVTAIMFSAILASLFVCTWAQDERPAVFVR
jgi:hypothetical protein